MTSVDNSAVGFAQAIPLENTKGTRLRIPFANEERLREERRGRTIVVVRIRDVVRVKLNPVVIEVEVRRVRELAISVRIIVFAHPWHRSLKAILIGNKARSDS